MMKFFQKHWWHMLYIVAIAVALGTSGIFLISCDKDSNDSPTSPSGDYCSGIASCPNGGWIKGCVKSNGCAYYLMSDGTKFHCDSCDVCDLAAQRAVNYCYGW